ncbi:MAG: molybdenum cofactor biosynthesis protein MoaE [Alphaproteobacteria bacterium]|nr:molybdenum cofactor biosynthesis protein MoaE [Alphaproteobacteria bacterium]
MVVRVQAEDFDVGQEFARFTQGRTDLGGVALFAGLVRADQGSVTAMTLEHYPGMTERQLEAIEAEARARWPLDDALIVHRVGRLLPGDRIVLVMTASAHRQASLDACHFLIDWLKTKAPFWKFEEGSSGGKWVDAKETDDEAASRWGK